MGLPASDAIQRWTTDDVPQDRRLDYFAAALSEAVYPLSVERADHATFRAEVSAANLSTISVCKTMASAHGASRHSDELARTNGHKYNLQMLSRPWVADHQGMHEMMPRDVLIIDSQYPMWTDVRSESIGIFVVVSDAWMRQWLPNPGVIAMRRIAGNSAWGSALSSYVSELSPELVKSPPLPLSVLADQVGSLLALTASAMQSGALKVNPAVRSLLERIDDCIAQRCTELQVTAADVARSIDVSVRTLHRALAATNQTFGERLVDARARAAIRMLTSPLFKRVTTAEIGRRAGFLSASHFARVIRRRTGRAPVELRRTARGEAGKPTPDGDD